MKDFTVQELIVLMSSWAEGTCGHLHEMQVIAELDELGRQIGYGALEQFCHWLKQIRCYGKQQEAADLKRERFRLLGWQLPANFEELAKRS